MERIICPKSKKQDAAVHRIIPTLMRTVTMKMWGIRWTKMIGVNANRLNITWLAFTEGGCNKFDCMEKIRCCKMRNGKNRFPFISFSGYI